MVALSVAALAFLVSLLSLQVTKSLPLFSFFLSLASPFVAFLFTLFLGQLSLLLLTFPFLARNAPLFVLNGLLLQAKFLSYPFPLRSSCIGIRRVVVVRLGPASLLGTGRFFAELDASNIANTLFNGSDINKFSDNVFCLLVNAGSLECSVDEGCCLAPVESEKLLWISFNFLLCHF